MDEMPTADRSGHLSIPPSFSIEHDPEPSGVLLAGFAEYGLAGLTAVDFLVDHLELTEMGHVDVAQLPAITPFEGGTPRHHTRFFSRPDLDVTVLVGELFIPVFAAGPFTTSLFDWIETASVDEMVLLSGVPMPHGPPDHRTFYIATEDFQATRLQETTLDPMGNGFLDGIPAAILQRGMDSPLRACVLTTPTHARAPDVEAAIRLVETVTELYDLPVDAAPLRAFADEIAEYYTELSDRLDQVQEAQKPEDRMFM